MSTKYQFRTVKGSGGRLNTPGDGKNAQVVGETLEQIRVTHGALTPPLVLDEARPEAAPLHGYFEWDNSIAAERFRVSQAGELIRAVYVAVTPAEAQEPVITRAFVSIEDGEDSRYEPLATVLSDAALYAQVCRRACAELEAFQDRYAQFQSLKSIAKTAHDAVQAELALAISSAANAA